MTTKTTPRRFMMLYAFALVIGMFGGFIIGHYVCPPPLPNYIVIQGEMHKVMGHD